MPAECHGNFTVILKRVAADCSETLVTTYKTGVIIYWIAMWQINFVCKISALFFSWSSTECYYGFGMSYLLWGFKLQSVEKHFDSSFVTNRMWFCNSTGTYTLNAHNNSVKCLTAAWMARIWSLLEMFVDCFLPPTSQRIIHNRMVIQD